MKLKMFFIWVLLVIFTLTAWTKDLQVNASTALMLVIGLSALKAWLIVSYYMEVKDAPWWLKALCVLWGGLVFGVISFCYLQPERLLDLHAYLT